MDENNNENGLPPGENGTPEENNHEINADDILNQASSQGSGGGDAVLGAMAEFDEFDEATVRSGEGEEKLSMLEDLKLNVYIELGRTKMQIKDILELERGYVIELDKLASEPVDIFVNNKKIAEGEVVVIDKHFGIRIVNLNDPEERLRGVY